MDKRDFRKKEVANILIKIMTELQKSEYGISKEKFISLVQKAKKAKIELISFNQRTIENKLYTDDNDYYASYTTDTIGKSHVVEEPPIFIGDDMYSLLPIINLMEYNDDNQFYSISYHEFSHFLATGDWTIVETNNEGRTEVEYVNGGICTDRYYYSQGEIVGAQLQNLDALVELLNEWVSSHLYESVEKKRYTANPNNREKGFDDFLNSCIQSRLNGNHKQLIGIYFSHNIQELEQVLLSQGKYNTLEDINDYFESITHSR